MLQEEYLKNEYKVTHKEYFWDSLDGKKLYAQKWDAGKNAQAALLLVHGLGEHSSRYSEFANNLAAKGISVLSFDHRGHGKTPGKPGAVSNYNKMLNDVELLDEKGKELFEGLPLFLMGHSLGGNLVTNYAMSTPLHFKGIILASPWFELTSSPGWLKITIANIFHRILPNVQARTGLKAEHMSREIRRVHEYKSDPLIHDKITIRLFKQAIDRGALASRSIYKINNNLLVMHGSNDQVTSFKASQKFIQNASQRTTFIEWKDAFHELHHDIDREDVFKSIVNWIFKTI